MRKKISWFEGSILGPEVVVGFGIKVFLHIQKISGICVCAGLGEIGPTLPGANKLKRLVEIGWALTDLLLKFYIVLHQWGPKRETTAMCGCIKNEMTKLCVKEIWLGAKAGGGGGGPTWSALIIELFKCRNFHRGSREGNNHNVELESRSDSSACCSQVEHGVSLISNRRTSYHL